MHSYLWQRLREMLPSNVTTRIRDTFALVEVAEEELAAAHRRHPNEPFFAAFLVLTPPVVFLGKNRIAFRHHCVELLERHAAGQDTRPATKAEVLLSMLDASLQAPPAQQPSALIDRLWRDVFPDADIGAEVTAEPWAGASEELLHTLRRRFGDDTRYQSKAVRSA